MQLKRYLERYNIRVTSCKDSLNAADSIRKCILSGYFPNVAKMLPDGTYRLVKGDTVLAIQEPELTAGTIRSSKFSHVQQKGQMGHVP